MMAAETALNPFFGSGRLLGTLPGRISKAAGAMAGN